MTALKIRLNKPSQVLEMLKMLLDPDTLELGAGGPSLPWERPCSQCITCFLRTS